MNEYWIDYKQGLVHILSTRRQSAQGFLLINVKFAGHEDLVYGMTFEICVTVFGAFFISGKAQGALLTFLLHSAILYSKRKVKTHTENQTFIST